MEMPVGEAAEKMINNRIKRLVVVGAVGELVSLVTMTDIIKWLAEQKEYSDSILHYVQGNID
jgi:CBS domain-containing protein